MADKADFAVNFQDALARLRESLFENKLTPVVSPEERAAYERDKFLKQNTGVKPVEAVQSGSAGMFGVVPSSGGGGDQAPELTKEQNQFFDWMESTPEGRAFKDERGTAMGHVLGMLAPGAGLVNMGKTLTGQPPSLTSLFSTPQSFYDWQEQQRQQSQEYINQSIDAIQRESASQQLATNPFYQGSYTPSGNAESYTPQDSSGNISWGGQTYSSAAYNDLMP